MSLAKKIVIILCILALSIFQLSNLHAQENEDELFNQESTTINKAKTEEITVFNSVKSVNFSGKIDTFQIINEELFSYTQADIFLDIRLPKNAKAFGDISFLTSPTQVTSANPNGVYADIKELFIDYNINQKIYFRTGKQFIKWGRGYFWNPVDFVNQSAANFINLEAIRSGATGLRIHFPKSAQENIYCFIDTSKATNIKDIAVVAKYEGLLGSTEWGISYWTKYKNTSRLGLDLSTRILDLDWTAEIAAKTSSWTPGIAIGINKDLPWERPNRITLHYETFYNGIGYNTNIINSLYQAAFISIKEFPIYSTTFSLNILQNITDNSGILSTGISYPIVDGLELNNSLLIYFGSQGSEYKKEKQTFSLLFQGILTF